MTIEFHKSFSKASKKLDSKIQKQLKERLVIFYSHPHDPQLNNHALHGKYLGCRSINITGDYRAIFQIIDDTYLFINVDTHGNLYS